MVQVLKQCGDDLTRENVMKQAASLKDLELGMLLPGIKINTSADGLLPDRADADAALQRRTLGGDRPGPERATRRELSGWVMSARQTSVIAGSVPATHALPVAGDDNQRRGRPAQGRP